MKQQMSLMHTYYKYKYFPPTIPPRSRRKGTFGNRANEFRPTALKNRQHAIQNCVFGYLDPKARYST